MSLWFWVCMCVCGCARGILYAEMPPEPFDSDFGLWPSEIYMPKYNEPVAPCARVDHAN